MSDEGRAFVKLHSPYTGNAWWFHYVMGDLANAQHQYRIFITDQSLAREWPLTRAACTRARAQMLADGYLQALSDTTAPGRPREYRFLFKGAEAMAKWSLDDAPQGDARRGPGAPQGDAGARRKVRRERASNGQPHLLPTEQVTEGVTPAAAPRATDDPLVRHAHGLATLAYDQTPKPVTRGGFPAVLARIEAELRAGTTEQAIRAAIVAGNVTWTADGLRTAIGRAKPRRNGNRDGDDRSLTQLVTDARRARA